MSEAGIKGIAEHIVVHEILGVQSSGSFGVHSRLLQSTLTLQDGQYIVAPSYFEIADGAELELAGDSELMIL